MFRRVRAATKGSAFGNRKLLKKFDQNFLSASHRNKSEQQRSSPIRRAKPLLFLFFLRKRQFARMKVFEDS